MKVLFLDRVHPILEQRLTDNGYQCIEGSNKPIDELKEEINQAQGMVVRSRLNLDEDFLKSAPHLQFIARAGAGMETIDEIYCSNNGIQLFNAPEGNRNAVAEHALGMLLALFNKLSKGDREVRKGIWDREGNRGIEMAGKTIGIIGYGNNGSQFAKLLSGFDCEILAHDKYKSGFETARIKEVDLDELYEKADVVSFHIPQTPETIFFGSTAFFTHFKKPIYLINLSRGKVVQLADLAEAIDSKKVLGACLDVLEIENKAFVNGFQSNTLPPEIKELLTNERVLFSPHVGGWTIESYFKLSNVLADKIILHFGSISS
jgi:D-3-phosphoglycerate dehydrogenase / 2-oxoglutarate reductase